MNDTYDGYEEEDEDERDMSWDEALEKAEEDPEGKATESFVNYPLPKGGGLPSNSSPD